MPDQFSKPDSLPSVAARQLATTTKIAPQYDAITPRWLTRFLEWKALDAGVFRLNKVKAGETLLDVLCSQQNNEEIPQGYIDYEPKPREYILNSISTIINIDSRIVDLFSNPYDQIKEQLRLSVESLKERQESQLINNNAYGLLNNIVETQRIKTRYGSPMPDDMDELISKVWKEPSFFLAHPMAIAAFGRECTRRGVPPPTVTLFGSVFMTWRGIPVVPSDKLFVDGLRKPKGKSGKTNIMLIRTGEQKQGVIGLYQAKLPAEQSRGLSVRFMGTDSKGISSYLLSIYCSTAALTDDAIAVLEDVEIGNYYEYK